MLDWAHELTLRAVDRGNYDDCPALQTLVATGLVNVVAEGGHSVTPAGRIALEDGEPSRGMRIAWALAALAAGAGAAAGVIDLFA